MFQDKEVKFIQFLFPCNGFTQLQNAHGEFSCIILFLGLCAVLQNCEDLYIWYANGLECGRSGWLLLDWPTFCTVSN